MAEQYKTTQVVIKSYGIIRVAAGDKYIHIITRVSYYC